MQKVALYNWSALRRAAGRLTQAAPKVNPWDRGLLSATGMPRGTVKDAVRAVNWGHHKTLTQGHKLLGPAEWLGQYGDDAYRAGSSAVRALLGL